MNWTDKLHPKSDDDGWAIIEVGFYPVELHVFPVYDSRAHHLNPTCWCCPERDKDTGDVLVHNPLQKDPS